MGTLYFTILIVVAVFLGHLFIKRQRKKLTAERLLKLKVAEGNFDHVVVAPAKPHRKKRRGWLSLGSLPEPPEYLVLQLRSAVPAAAEKLLRARQALQAARTARYQADKAFVEGLKQSALPALPRGNKQNACDFLATATLHQLQFRRLTRAALLSRTAFDKATKAHKSAIRSLESSLHILVKFDQTLLDFADERMMEIARVVLAEGKVDVTYPKLGNVEVPELDAEPKVADAQAAVMLEQLQELHAELLCTFSTARQAEGIVRAAQIAQTAAGKVARPADPAKPIELDVCAWIEEANLWVANVQDADQVLQAALPDLYSALTDCDRQRDVIAEMFRKIDALENEFKEKVKLEKAARKPMWSPSPHSGGLFGLTPDRNQGSNPGPSRFNFDLSAEDSLEDRFSAPIPPADESVCWLTDEQESKRQVYLALWAPVTRLLEAMRLWPKCQQLWLDDGLSDADRKQLGAAQATVRKLGYARAQANAAKAKLASVKEEPLPEAAADCTLDEQNVETYIRDHRRHRQERARRAQVSEERARRISAQEAQVAERQEQVVQCTTALSAAKTLLKGDSLVVPKEVDAAMRVVNLHVGSPAG